MLTPSRKIAVLVAVLLVAGAAAFLIAAPFRAEEASPAAPSGASVQKRWTAVAPGRVEPLSRDIRIAAPVIGRIAEVLVKPNDRVFAGELLVRLDDGEALARLAAAEAQAALRKRVRNDASTPKGSAERRKAEDAVADAERALTEARAGLDRPAAARRAGRTSQAGLDSARVALSLAQDRLREQQDALRRVKAAPGTALPSRLEGELNVSRAELTLAEAELEKTRIRSPLAGTVLQVPGQTGRAGDSLIGAAAGLARRCLGLAGARGIGREGSGQDSRRAARGGARRRVSRSGVRGQGCVDRTDCGAEPHQCQGPAQVERCRRHGGARRFGGSGAAGAGHAGRGVFQLGHGRPPRIAIAACSPACADPCARSAHERSVLPPRT